MRMELISDLGLICAVAVLVLLAIFGLPGEQESVAAEKKDTVPVASRPCGIRSWPLPAWPFSWLQGFSGPAPSGSRTVAAHGKFAPKIVVCASRLPFR
jgi:hypothetical protein